MSQNYIWKALGDILTGISQSPHHLSLHHSHSENFFCPVLGNIISWSEELAQLSQKLQERKGSYFHLSQHLQDLLTQED